MIAALLAALNYASLGRGGAERINQAFASGALGDDDFRRGDAIRGYHQYNDCLILGMALDQRYPSRELVVSPSIPFGPSDTVICKGLKHPPITDRFFYHNYVHGQVTLVRFLLPSMSVEQIRNLYRLLITLALVAGIGLAMLRRNWVFLIVLLAFARCFGLETFGQSLAHGPADLVLVGYVVFLSLGPKSVVVPAAIFGALTMIFEMMTGGLPLGLAVVIGLTWFAVPEKVLQSAAAYLSAAATVLFLKYAAVLIVFGTGGLQQIFGSLSTRMNGHTPDFMGGRSWLHSVFGNMEAMMPGLGPMAGLLLLLAIGFAARELIRNPTTENKLLAASNLPIVLWLVAFHQHAIVHAWFMDRMLVWPIATGFAIFLLTNNCLRLPGARHTACGHKAESGCAGPLVDRERVA